MWYARFRPLSVTYLKMVGISDPRMIHRSVPQYCGME